MAEKRQDGTAKASMRGEAWTDRAKAAVDRFDPTPTAMRRVAAVGVAGASRILMQRLNRVEVAGQESIDEARSLQHPGRGLLTFSNHVGLFDDPWLLSCFSGPEWSSLRWVAADAINFFGTPLKATVFNAGKAVPVVRGAGIHQPGMTFLADRLRAGEWVHVFPEGGRSREPEGRFSRPLKGGMAQLVRDTQPMMLGFYHRGMHAIAPIGSWVPRIGKTVTVRFGEIRHSEAFDLDPEVTMSWVEQELLRLEALACGER
jgi:monolysocardiolipin acyltransferase